jgi:septal ring factor EnvC (AmiA/AmiB activator)
MRGHLGLLAAVLFPAVAAFAQDVPGIEVCTAEKSIDRRLGCMQSNINYLQQLISKRAADSQQKIDAANADIAKLKAAVAQLQKSVDDLQATIRKPAESKPADPKAAPAPKP